MTIVVCREEDFRRQAMRHGADTFVEVADPRDSVVPFRLVALRSGVPGPIATYVNHCTEDAWLWSDVEPLLIACDEMDETPSLWDAVRDWTAAALLLVLCGVLYGVFVAFGA